jgi:hypothetical protein
MGDEEDATGLAPTELGEVVETQAHTEMAGVAGAKTGSIYAWGLDDDPDEIPVGPSQRLTSRRITAVGVATSLVVVTGVIAFVVNRQHNRPKAQSATVVATVAAPTPTVTMTLPPPVTVTVAAPSITVAAPIGPTIGDACTDRMKFATDPLSGQEMICDNYSDTISREGLKWFSAEKGAVGPDVGAADLPRVGRVGSSCAGEVLTTQGRSSDGYVVWCNGGPGSYMPGTTAPTWMVFHP